MSDSTLQIQNYITIPPLYRQTSYLVTGCFAGACTVPVSALLARSTSVPFLTPTLRAGPRFLIFYLTRDNLPSSFPVPLVGGLSGAAGGAAEVLSYSLVAQRTFPSLRAVASHSGKLFLGFGTFTGLSSYLSKELPPKPFPFCWLLGAVAGAVATGVGELVERGGKVGPKQLAKTAGSGAAVVGTVIAVHVTSCSKLLGWIEGGRG